MVRICKGRTVTAFLTGHTSHDRYVARCYLDGGEDIAAELVRRGLALDWPLFSNGAYRAFEQPRFRSRLSAIRRKMRDDAAAAGAGAAAPEAAPAARVTPPAPRP